MNKRMLALAVLFGAGSAWAEDFVVAAPVSAALLYQDMAEVTRQVTVDVPHAGRHQIVVAHALPGTVQPTVEGATLLAVSRRTDKAGLELLWAENEQKLAVTKRMMQALVDGLANGATLDAVQTQLPALQEEYAALLQTQAMLRKQREAGSEDTLVFDVDVPTAGSVSLTWQTQTAQAHWQPTSDWRLHTDSGRLDMRAYANVVQETGLDWADTVLTLAVVPPEYVYPPLLEAQTVRAVDPEQYDAPVAMEMRQKNASPLMAAFAAAPEAAPKIEASGVDFRVTLPGRYDLPSGKNGLSAVYWQGSADAQVYSAVYDWAWPQDTALLSAAWTMPDGMNVLPGEMNLYRDGNRVTQMRGQRQLMAAGSKQSLSFGVDPQLHVEMRNPPNYTESHGLLRRSSALSQRVILLMDNQGSADKVVRVYTRLPVSTQEAVTVTPLWSPKPTAQDVDSVKGLTLWQKTLKPQEQWQVDSGFDIDYPEGKELIGI